MKDGQIVGNLNVVVFAVVFFRLTEGCPTVCSCSDTTVDCSDQTLTEIPTDIPANTKVLHLNNNELTRLGNGSFIAFPEMLYLYLDHNKIGNISADAFIGIERLYRLQLNNNLLTSLPPTVFSGLEHLAELRLDSNSLTALHQTVFHDLHNLKFLYLYRNNLAFLPETIFTGLEHLYLLYIHSNEIQILHEGIFKDLKNLNILRFDENQITHLSENIFKSNNNLQLLWLHYNKISCLPREIFSGLSNVFSLFLYSNKIRDLPDSIFQGQGKLRTLHLDTNLLTFLPDNIFKDLKDVKTIRLNSNSLHRLSHSTFKGLFNLETLYLNNNDITTLPGNIFEDLEKLHTLLLYGNPWSCDCRLQNIRAWLDDNRDRLLFGATSRCEAPDRNQGSDMLQVPIGDLTCYPKPIFNETIKTIHAEAGENVTLDCDVVGIPEPHLHWIIPSGKTLYSGVEVTCFDEKIIQQEDGSLFIPFVDKTKEGVYSCIATNSEGTSSGIRIVKVNFTSETISSMSPMTSPEITSTTGVYETTIFTTVDDETTQEVFSTVGTTTRNHRSTMVYTDLGTTAETISSMKTSSPTKPRTSTPSMQSPEIKATTMKDEFTTTTKNEEILTSNGKTNHLSTSDMTESVHTAMLPITGTDGSTLSAVMWGVLGYSSGIITTVVVIIFWFVIRHCRNKSITSSDDNQVQEEYNLYEDLHDISHRGIDKHSAKSDVKREATHGRELEEVSPRRLVSSPARVHANRAGHMMYVNSAVIEDVDVNYASLSPETRERNIYASVA